MRLTLYQHLDPAQSLTFIGLDQDAILANLSDWMSDAEIEDVDGLCLLPELTHWQGSITYTAEPQDAFPWEVATPTGQVDIFDDFDDALVAFVGMVGEFGQFEEG